MKVEVLLFIERYGFKFNRRHPTLCDLCIAHYGLGRRIDDEVLAYHDEHTS